MTSIPLNVLLIENLLADSELILYALRNAGFEPNWRRVDSEADFLANLDPEPEIILADYKLPGWNALGALHILQAQERDIPFIVVSGTSGEDAALECFRQGANDYLIKDHLDQLGEAVIRCLTRKRLRLEHEATVQALQQLKEFHQNIVEAISEGVMILNQDLVITFVNPAACVLLGYDKTLLTGLNLRQANFLVPSDWDLVVIPQRESEQYETGDTRAASTIRQYELEIIHQDTKRRTLLVNARLQFGKGPQYDILATFTDITERKKADAQIQKLHSAVEQSSSSIVLTDLQGDIEYVNPKFTQVTGYSAEEVIGHNPRILQSGKTPKMVYQQLWDSIIAGGEWHSEIHNKKKNGELFWEFASMSAVKDSEGRVTGFLAVKDDITERRQMENKIRKLNRTLALVNETNQAIIRIRTLPDLFQEVCRIAVDTGGLWMAWLGLLDLETGAVYPVASAGTTGDYLEQLDIRINDPLRGNGPTGTVISTGIHNVANDIANDPRMIPWRENALRFGYHASAVFPLKVDGQTRGTLNLYAKETGFFNDEEIALLDEMAADISFAMEFSKQETQRLEAEQALQGHMKLIEEMHVFLQTALDAFPANTVVLDANGVIINVNQPWIHFNAENHSSLDTTTDYLGTNYLTVCDIATGRDSEEAKPVANGIRAVIHGQQAEFNCEYPCDSPTEARWFMMQVTPFPEAPPRRVLVAHINITERKLAERRLQEAHDLLEQRVIHRTQELQVSKQRVEAILNNNPAGILLLSPDLRIRQTNPAFNGLFASQPDEYYNKSLFDLVYEDDAPNIEAAVQIVTIEQIIQRVEARIRRKDEVVIYAEFNIGYIPDNGLVCVINDVTVRKRAEEMLHKALLAEKELSELKTRFVSMASHEVRTPLATILATTDTLSAYRQRLSDEQIDLKFTRIKDQVQHLKEIMDDVLTLTRLQSGHVEFDPAPLNLDLLCRTIIDEFQSRTDVHHQFQYACDGNVREAMLDKKLMRQAFSNILTNAMKYSPADKPVTIKLVFAPEAITLSVADQGIGIPENDQKRLFEPFHRAENVGAIAGTGLGLTITKNAVEMHGGTISAISQVNGGTTFTICIPFVALADAGVDQ